MGTLCLEFLSILRLGAVGGERCRVVVHMGGVPRLVRGGEEGRVVLETGVCLGLFDSRVDFGPLPGLVVRCRERCACSECVLLVW